MGDDLDYNSCQNPLSKNKSNDNKNDENNININNNNTSNSLINNNNTSVNNALNLTHNKTSHEALNCPDFACTCNIHKGHLSRGLKRTLSTGCQADCTIFMSVSPPTVGVATAKGRNTDCFLSSSYKIPEASIISQASSIHPSDQYMFCLYGQLIFHRFKLLKSLGYGVFSEVFLARDIQDRQFYALKIVRKEKKFLDQTMQELRILDHITRVDYEMKVPVIHLFQSFCSEGHFIMRFEAFEESLADRLKVNPCGLSLDHIQSISQSLLEGLVFLENEGIIHADIKPQNIMIDCSGPYPKSCIIDFGSSFFVGDHLQDYLQSRYYRSPEVLLNLTSDYSCAMDMWGFGCILMEMLLGHVLFQGRNAFDQLYLIYKSLGKFPVADFVIHLVDQGSSSVCTAATFSMGNISWFFNNEGLIKPKIRDQFLKYAKGLGREHRAHFKRTQLSIKTIIENKISWELNEEEEEARALGTVLERILVWNANKRLRATEVIKHQFFSASYMHLKEPSPTASFHIGSD